MITMTSTRPPRINRTHLGRRARPEPVPVPETTWISRKDAAERLGVALSTLDGWRLAGKHDLRHEKHDGVTVYDKASVERVARARAVS